MFVKLTSGGSEFILNTDNIAEIHPHKSGGSSIYLNIATTDEFISVHCDMTLHEFEEILIT